MNTLAGFMIDNISPRAYIVGRIIHGQWNQGAEAKSPHTNIMPLKMHRYTLIEQSNILIEQSSLS